MYSDTQEFFQKKHMAACGLKIISIPLTSFAPFINLTQLIFQKKRTRVRYDRFFIPLTSFANLIDVKLIPKRSFKRSAHAFDLKSDLFD